ncbi:Hypothetical protein EIN_307570, partial [Entamoeba invadens IP1]
MLFYTFLFRCLALCVCDFSKSKQCFGKKLLSFWIVLGCFLFASFLIDQNGKLLIFINKTI